MKLFRDPEERFYCFADGDDPTAPPAGGGGGDPPAADPPADTGDGSTPPAAAADGATPPADKDKRPPADWRDKQINRQHGKIKTLEQQLEEQRTENQRLRELAEAGNRRAAPPADPPAPVRRAEPPAPRTEPPAPRTADEGAIRQQERFKLQVENMDAALTDQYGDAKPAVLQNLGMLDENERVALISDVLNTDDAAYVMSVVGKDPEKLQQLVEMPQGRRQAELIKVALGKQAKPAPKRPSAAPEPPAGDRAPAGRTPPGGSNIYDDKLPDDAWYAARLAQKRESTGRPWSVGGKAGAAR